MRTISLINLKGGVGKTTTSINMAVILAKLYHQRVLIVDNDVQANVTKYFDLHDYDRPSMEYVYRYDSDEYGIKSIIQPAEIPGLSIDILPSNMNMDDALTELIKDPSRDQIMVLKNALEKIRDDYDFCIIDNPPGVGLNILNALVSANDVIIPIKIDKNALDGMQDLVEIADDMKTFNPDLNSLKCLVTMYCKDMYAGDIVLRKSDYPVYKTRIRYSRMVDRWTFEKGSGLITYSPRSAATVDYKIFVKEYLDSLPKAVRKEVFSHAKN